VHLLLCVSRLLENTQHTKRGPRWWLFLSFIIDDASSVGELLDAF